MRYLLACLALVACDADPTPGHPNDCGSAWVAWCDQIFDCHTAGGFGGFGIEDFQAFSREDCRAKVAWPTPTSLGAIGCESVTDLVGAQCRPAIQAITCNDGQVYPGHVFAAVEACQ